MALWAPNTFGEVRAGDIYVERVATAAFYRKGKFHFVILSSRQRTVHVYVAGTRPCFGCAKEMLQAQVYAVYYLHEWTPHVKGEDLKTTHQRAEYEKLLLRSQAAFTLIPMPDPQQKWTVSNKTSIPINTDEHGIQDI